MSIREVTIDDITDIGEIYIQAFNHQPESVKFYKLDPYVKFCLDEGYAFIAEDNGEIMVHPFDILAKWTTVSITISFI